MVLVIAGVDKCELKSVENLAPRAGMYTFIKKNKKLFTIIDRPHSQQTRRIYIMHVQTYTKKIKKTYKI